MKKILAGITLAVFAFAGRASGGTFFGALSNFDAVNDTGSPCEGFEIELDDIQSADVSYTFQYQRYGVPKITEDTVNGPTHPRTFVRWMSPYDQVNHVFTQTTPVAPLGFKDTGGHLCFKNMSVNGQPYDTAGCEHFGVGTIKNPTNTVYRWMKENPTTPGSLIAQGSPVTIPAPVWAVPPGANPVVVAVIPVPPPPAVVPVPYLPNAEFGVAVWAKVYETESPSQADLHHLVSDDVAVPGNHGDVPAPNTVTEIEWQILQTDAMNPSVNELSSSRQMGNGNESVTRRYEFYKYVGPYDVNSPDGANTGTNEALCASVGGDGVHGGAGSPVIYDTNGIGHIVDCTTTPVVGEYIGAQNAAADVATPLSANDVDPLSLVDGEVGVRYPDRPLIFGGSGGPYSITFTGGTLPAADLGNEFHLDSVTGVLTGGVPNGTGTARFTVHATDLVEPAQPPVDATFNITVVGAATVDSLVIPNGAPNVQTSVNLTASGGETPFRWTAVPKTVGLQASVLGNTLSLSASNPGVFNVQVTVDDSLGGTNTKTLAFNVSAPGDCANVICAALDNCHDIGVCDAATGVCSNPAKPNGTGCDDGNPNTVNDVCTAGVCAGTDLCANVICTAQDACHDIGVCAIATGGCSNPPSPNGTGCDDGNPNTVNDVCTAGVCAGTDLCASVICTAQDACHDIGVCNPITGVCTTPAKPDGATCDDGNVCTIHDACAGGICVGDPNHCGDGLVQTACGEQCDDGGTTVSSGCNATCQIEPVGRVCLRAIGKQSRVLAAKDLTLMQACLDRVASGKLICSPANACVLNPTAKTPTTVPGSTCVAAVDCCPDFDNVTAGKTTDEKLSIAFDKAAKVVSRACSLNAGTDKVKGTADDTYVVPQTLGFGTTCLDIFGECSSVATTSLTSPGSNNDLMECMQCAALTLATDTLGFSYPLAATSAAETACQKAIGLNARKAGVQELTLRQRCQDKVANGKLTCQSSQCVINPASRNAVTVTGSSCATAADCCPAFDNANPATSTQSKTSAYETSIATASKKACSMAAGPDKIKGTADDTYIAPQPLGFATSCLDVFGQCGMISTTSMVASGANDDLIECVACVMESATARFTAFFGSPQP